MSSAKQSVDGSSELGLELTYRQFILDRWSCAANGRRRGCWAELSRYVKCDPTALSAIFAGRREVPMPMALRIAAFIGLDDLSTELLVELIYFETAEHHRLKAIHRRRVLQLIELTSEPSHNLVIQTPAN